MTLIVAPVFCHLASSLCDNASHKYRVLLMFMYDTGIRGPTELMNVRVSDFCGEFKKLHIREETAKKGSFGRKISLMLCADMVSQYVADEGLKGDDQLFAIAPHVVNRYLQRLARKVLGDGMACLSPSSTSCIRSAITSPACVLTMQVAHRKALAWLGHSSSEILDPYYHLHDADSQSAMQSLANDTFNADGPADDIAGELTEGMTDQAKSPGADMEGLTKSRTRRPALRAT